MDGFDWKLWWGLIATASACVAILIAYHEHRDADRQRRQKWNAQATCSGLGIENRRLKRELGESEAAREVEERMG